MYFIYVLKILHNVFNYYIFKCISFMCLKILYNVFNYYTFKYIPFMFNYKYDNITGKYLGFCREANDFPENTSYCFY